MMTVLAILLLIIVGGLFVAMAMTPMVAETERRAAPAPPRTIEPPLISSSTWEDHRHAA